MKKLSLSFALIIGFVSQNVMLNAQTNKVPESIGAYKLVWNDEFDKDGKPDPSKWAFDNGFIRNQEPQWYQPENAVCKNGFLEITAIKEEKQNPNYDSTSKDWRLNRKTAHYTSSCLITKGIFDFTYGKIFMRGKIDTKQGMWPAFWMLGSNRGPVRWPACGEVDIMEFYRKKLLGNIFWEGGMKDTKIPLDKLGEGWSDEFHEWELEWTKDSMIITQDGKLVNSFDISKTINKKMGNNPFHEKMYLVLNLALGQGRESIPDENLPAKFIVDYVRVYQK
ncbi:MAG: beta-glucanase [Pseudopedobacter saltans]|uniref:Beta-glucanase n=1 Tax=Pseudopedobacter saltans TaxID=151895 RepID=A0A2W5F4W9_9SPHI|nr:MAG: beta-glucanase [Pseudopedobacter saltans]